jgi:hypothetical protein
VISPVCDRRRKLTIDVVVVVVVVSIHHHLHSRGGFKECREKFSKKNAKNTCTKKFDEKGGILLRIFDLTTLHTISNYIRQKTRKERECFCAREEYIFRASLISAR